MKKVFIFAVAVVIMTLLLRNHSTSKMIAEPVAKVAKTRASPRSPEVKLSPEIAAVPAMKRSTALTPGGDPFQEQILNLWRRHASPAEVAVLLKALYEKDPKHLFQAILALSQSPPQSRKTLVLLLANALTLWPEAEGRDVFPIADAYGEMDLPSAAQWAATFLTATGRSDLNVAALLGQFAGTSESQALALIATLPDAARTAAIQSAANHIPINDLNHLMDVCRQLDPNGSAQFSQLLFQRLATDRLNDTAAWLAGTPSADTIPGAAAAIGQGMVLAGDSQHAVAWADSLPDQTARGQAIAAIYQQWNNNNPTTAIQDILSAYPGASQSMADPGQASASPDLTAYWNAALGMSNPSARAYAIASLIEPLLLTSGLADTQTKIAALTPNSLEQTVAQLTMHDDLQKSQVAIALQNGGKP